MQFHPLDDTLPVLKDEDTNILLLDLEGVMTRGMLGKGPNLGSIFWFHMQGEADGVYSEEARRWVEDLVRKHNFRIVLITRHGRNESEILQRRLDHAGIEKAWMFRDPDAIGDGGAKDEGIKDWRDRNPHFPLERIVCIEDHPENIHVIPADRIVGVNGDRGMVYRDYKKVLAIMGFSDAKTGAKASFPPAPPARPA